MSFMRENIDLNEVRMFDNTTEFQTLEQRTFQRINMDTLKLNLDSKVPQYNAFKGRNLNTMQAKRPLKSASNYR